MTSKKGSARLEKGHPAKKILHLDGVIFNIEKITVFIATH